MASAASALQCPRCRAAGHAAKDCQSLPFLRDRTLAEQRQQRQRQRAESRAAWEARQAESEKKAAAWRAQRAESEEKRAEWERKQEAWRARQAQRKVAGRPADGDDWEASSQTTTAASTAETAAALTAEDEEEIERRVAADKVVRRHEKVLREIAKLEGRDDLDALQRAKLQRRPEAEAELSAARGLVRAVARNELRLAVRA